MNSLDTSNDAQNGALITYVLTALFGWLGALIGWLIWKNKGAFAKDQTTEALNFGITTLIGFVIIGVLAYVMSILSFLSGLLWIVQIVLSVMGAIAVNKGTRYRYPFALRLIP
jgi:uncharacterized protein